MNTKYIIIPIVALGILVVGAACSNQTNTNQPRIKNVAQDPNEPLVLHNLGGAIFMPHTPGIATAGSFRFSKTYLDANAGRIVPVYLFGQPLPGRTKVQLNPNLEFGGMPNTIPVVSAIDGIVAHIREQPESKDFEVFLQPKENSIWTVGYDHLTNLTVREGDRVTVGRTLGKPGRENNGMYRYELQINKDYQGTTTFHCPTSLLDDTVRVSTTLSIERFISDWNTFYGSTAYGTYRSSCAQDVLTVAEEGG